MTRKTITSFVQADVVIKSRRRCALCVYLENNTAERPGQIAHLNGDNSDARFDNLVWLCLDHHDKFDSRTSQTKNYTPLEVKTYRDLLYKSFESSPFSLEDIKMVQSFIRTHEGLFAYLFDEGSGLACKMHEDAFDVATTLRDFWTSDPLRSFNATIREAQDHIVNNLAGILSTYDIDKYDLVGSYIRYDSHRFGADILDKKKVEVATYVESMKVSFAKLESVATS